MYDEAHNSWIDRYVHACVRMYATLHILIDRIPAVHLPTDHDLYNLAVGVTVGWGGAIVLRYVFREVLSNVTVMAVLRYVTFRAENRHVRLGSLNSSRNVDDHTMTIKF
jgi:hypothetical protein